MSRRSLAVLCCAVLLLLVLLLSGVGRKVGGERAKVGESRNSKSFCKRPRQKKKWQPGGVMACAEAMVQLSAVCQLVLK